MKGKTLPVREDFDRAIEAALAKAPSRTQYDTSMQRKRGLEDELEALEAQLVSAPTTVDDLTHAESAAEALASGKPEPDKSQHAIASRASTLDRIGVVKRAIELVDVRLRELRIALTSEIAPTMRKLHEASVSAMATALIAASEAITSEGSLREALMGRGLGMGQIRPLPIRSGIGTLTDRYSRLSNWLNEARAHGYDV